MMTDEQFMLEALKEASKAFDAGEVPIGAVLVNEDGFIISRGRNRIEELNDATQHAEMIALREGIKLLGRRLKGCTLYSTVEPCPMCAGAIVLSRVDRLVYGVYDSKAGAIESLFNIADNPSMNHRLQLRAGVLESECRDLLQRFFTSRRLR